MFKKIFAIIMALLVVSPAFAIEETQSHKFTNFKERIILAFTFDEEKKAEKMLEFANIRIEKLESSSDPELKSTVLSEYEIYVGNVEAVAEKSNNEQLKERLAESKRVHIEVLGEVYTDANEKEKYRIEKILSENLDDIKDSSVSLSAEEIQKVETITSKRESAPRLEIGSIGKEASGDVSNEGKVCIQVIQPARKDGECREFSTPCAVPKDWTHVPSCDVVSDVSSVNIVQKDPAGTSPPDFRSGVTDTKVDSGIGKTPVPSTTPGVDTVKSVVNVNSNSQKEEKSKKDKS